MPIRSLVKLGAGSGGGGGVISVNGKTGVVTLNSSEIPEQSPNFYFTQTRFDTAFAAKTTDDLAEGILNLYFTDARVTNSPAVLANTSKVSADGSVGTHSDVDLTGIVAGQVLEWNGSTFLPVTPTPAPVDSVNGQTGVVVLDTDDVAEGVTNLYYTQARFDSAFGAKTTDDLTEGVTNLYYTTGRFNVDFATKTTDDLTEGGSNLYYTDARFDVRFGTKSTDDLTEGVTNLYYTDARVAAAPAVVANTAKVSADGSIDTHSDVDTTTTPPNPAEYLAWDGSNWVPTAPSMAPVTSVNGQTGVVVLDTDDVAEGATNFYYTETRFDTSFAGKTTTDLTEGVNLYYTQARFDSAFALKNTDDLSEGVTNLYYTSARFDTDFAGKTTTDLAEGTNLYYTETRVSNNPSVVANTAKVSADGTVGTHSDVDLTGIVAGQTLEWNGATFVAANLTNTVNGFSGDVSLDADDIPEGTTNFYFTNARFDTAFSAKSTDDLVEGVTNLYYTDARVSSNPDVAANTLKVSADGSIDTHSDVDTTTDPPAIGEYLAWDGSNWVPVPPSMAPVTSVNGQTGVVVLDSDDITEGVSNLYYTSARFDADFATKTTTDLAEGTNLYYTQGRFDTAFAAKNTDDLSEGVTNLYFTDARVTASPAVVANTAKVSADGSVGTHSDVDLTGISIGDVLEWNGATFLPVAPTPAPVDSVNGQTGAVVLNSDDISEGVTNLYYTSARFDADFAGKTTTDLAEGTNLYYTQTRFDNAFAAKDTDDLAEGVVNFYYTETRFDNSFALKSTDDLGEGGTNLYYTEARVSANPSVVANTAKVSADGSVDTHSDVDTTTTPPAVGEVLQWDGSNWVPAAAGGGVVDSVNGQTGVVVLDTDDIAEGVTNLYFTDARVAASPAVAANTAAIAAAIDVSTGVPDAGKLVKTEADGTLDFTFINEAVDGFRVRSGVNSDFDLIFEPDTGASPNGASISKQGASGFLSYMPNATVSQIIFSNPSNPNGVNSVFLDVDMQGQMNLNTLGGAGAGADVVATTGAAFRAATDLTSTLGAPSQRWQKIYGTGMTYRVSQTAHGFTVPSYGVLPVYYNNVTGNYEEAQADDVGTAADAVVVSVLDADTFEIQEGGFVYGAHGLDVGKWHVLDDSTAGEAVALDAYTSENVQYLFFTVDANTILLRLDPIYVRSVEGPAISVLQNWVQQATAPTVPAGTNRMQQININWEDDVTNGIASVTIGGVAATLVEEQTITSGFSQGCHVFCIIESEIAAVVGNTVVITWNNGVPLSFSTAFASFENINQITPVVDTNTDSGLGTPDTMDADVTAEEDGYVFVCASGGNDPITFTNNGTGFTRQLDLTIASADGVIDDKFITVDTLSENVNMTLTGSNRHVMVAASYRKA